MTGRKETLNQVLPKEIETLDAHFEEVRRCQHYPHTQSLSQVLSADDLGQREPSDSFPEVPETGAPPTTSNSCSSLSASVPVSVSKSSPFF